MLYNIINWIDWYGMTLWFGSWNYNTIIWNILLKKFLREKALLFVIEKNRHLIYFGIYRYRLRTAQVLLVWYASYLVPVSVSHFRYKGNLCRYSTNRYGAVSYQWTPLIIGHEFFWTGYIPSYSMKVPAPEFSTLFKNSSIKHDLFGSQL